MSGASPALPDPGPVDTSWAELVDYHVDETAGTMTATIRDRGTGRTFVVEGTVTAVVRDEATR